jgi:hypothetical protein
MSDLTRNHMLPCERCGRPCDAFTLHSWRKTGKADIAVVQFCTYHCAAEYHKVTGFRVWRQEEKSSAVRGPTVIEPGLPLYRKEVQTLEEQVMHRELLREAMEKIVYELLEECYG